MVGNFFFPFYCFDYRTFVDNLASRLYDVIMSNCFGVILNVVNPPRRCGCWG